MRTLGIIGPLFLIGCQEYNIEGAVPDYQGPNPPALPDERVLDSIVQVTEPKADILFVLDNTPTMRDGNLADVYSNFPAFMNYFLDSGIDYHIGVISTNTAAKQDGKLATVSGQKWVDSSSKNAVQLFSQLGKSIPAADGSPATESGIATTYTAIELDAKGYNQGFLRNAATLNIVVMSDEDDQSPKNPISKDEFISYLKDLDKPSVTFSSVVCHPGDPCDYIPTAVGYRYLDVTNAIGGVLWPIDSTPYDSVLTKLGLQAAGLRTEYFLSTLPVPGTIEVTVMDPKGKIYTFKEGTSCDKPHTDWFYTADRNSVTFCTFIPPALSAVHIEYTSLPAAAGGSE